MITPCQATLILLDPYQQSLGYLRIFERFGSVSVCHSVTVEEFLRVCLTVSVLLKPSLLDDNMLTGTIPTELGMLTSLKSLHLGKNLQGLEFWVLCECFFFLSECFLVPLMTDNNVLTGSIPYELEKLSDLFIKWSKSCFSSRSPGE
jgi:hypothetical protein